MAFSEDKLRLESSVDKEKYYAYITMDRETLLKQLAVAHRHFTNQGTNTVYFLDVGCGAGNVLLTAELFFRFKRGFPEYGPYISTYGIEHERELATIAKAILHDRIIVCADAFNPTEGTGAFPTRVRYNEMDVIYYYSPIRDKELMSKLERKIEDEARVGAIIIANLKHDERILKDVRFKKLSGGRNELSGVYLKVSEHPKKDKKKTTKKPAKKKV